MPYHTPEDFERQFVSGNIYLSLSTIPVSEIEHLQTCSKENGTQVCGKMTMVQRWYGKFHPC